MRTISGVALLDKAFIVWLVFSKAPNSFVNGFWIPFVVDSTVVLYTIGYFLTIGWRDAKPTMPDPNLQN